MAREAAKAFGRFQSLIADLPEPRLHDTIPDFHNTPKRFSRFQEVLAANKLNRAHDCQSEIEFALGCQDLAKVLLTMFERGEIPERITHNDTKLNNVLFDNKTGEAICVIDLDTIMPGLAAYDFGDLVRTSTCFAEEDERDLSKVQFEMPMFEALADGYFSTASGFLSSKEQESMSIAGQVITFETGLRFLTDYLEGDNYFRIHRPDHNLDRCRTQFKLVQEMDKQSSQMKKVISAARLKYE
jgi:thiamine kinase-like enzyme